MPNMSLVKNPMPSQAPDVRNKNFSEVALGYTPETAMDEAKRWYLLAARQKHREAAAKCRKLKIM